MYNYPCIQSYIFDPMQAAHQIELILKDDLKPPEQGLYECGKMRPTIVADQHYHKRVKNNGTITYNPVIEISDMVGDIYNADGDLILSDKKKYKLTLAPTIPVRGIGIVFAYIKEAIDDHAIWRERNRYTSQVSAYFTNSVDETLLIEVDKILLPLRARIHHFLGDDRWIMHFLKMLGTDMVVQKSCDYRIAEWTKEQLRKKAREKHELNNEYLFISNITY